MQQKKPEILKGNSFSDERGELLFNNDFDMLPIKRFYIIRHTDKKVIRAWQGHQIEHKFFKCINGSFVVVWKKIDDFTNPNDANQPKFAILQKKENNILSIPPGYVNGLKALEDNSEILVFSNFYLGEVSDDSFRFDKNLWFDWNQF
jgi:dTDP-4-dehydrorhamnose 3,5-epimerase